MFSPHFVGFRERALRGVAILIFLVAAIVVRPPAVDASPCGETAMHCVVSVGHAPIADVTNEVMGNRTRMIQVACVVVAIGIFVLSRACK